MKRLVTAVLCLLSIAALASGQKAGVDGQAILAHIKVLADDALEGRKSGLPGGEKAAAWIASQLKEWGLEPAGDKGSYYQEFDLEDLFAVEPGASLAFEAGGVERAFACDGGIFDDWRVCDFSGSGSFAAEVVLAGYGLSFPEKGYDDYEGVDVRGKAVLINIGFPGKLAAIAGEDFSLAQRIRAARKHGAKAVLLSPDPAPIGRHTTYPMAIPVERGDYDPGLVVIGINEAILDFVVDRLPIDQRVYYAKIQSSGKPNPVATGITAKVNMKTSVTPKPHTRNVLAKISGTDKALKNEFVILGAHMDHLGLSPAGGPFNGANDNASGTAVVMEIARLMKTENIKPKRTVVFALWAAEEQGLIGSDYYVNNPLFPLERTVANINLDMVGQGGPTVGLGGIYFSSELYDLLKSKVPADVWSGMMPRRGVGGSDHLSFLGKGINAFHMVGMGDHLKGHHYRDDPDLIDIGQLERAGRFLWSAALVLADAKQSLIPPGRAGLTKFRYEESVNCVAMTPDEAVAQHGSVVNPDVDFQLAVLDGRPGLAPDEARVAILKELAGLPGKLSKAPGLSLYGQPSDPMLRPPARGTVLVASLAAGRIVRDDPDWLPIYAKHGLKVLLVGGEDVEVSNGTLSAASAKMLQAAEQAGIVIVLESIRQEDSAPVLAALMKPCLYIASELPSGPALEALNKGRHVLGLTFRRGEGPAEYFEALKKACATLTSEKVFVWNETDLWSASAKADYAALVGSLLKEGWEKERIRHSRQTPLSDVMYSSFFNLLRMNQRRAD